MKQPKLSDKTIVLMDEVIKLYGAGSQDEMVYRALQLMHHIHTYPFSFRREPVPLHSKTTEITLQVTHIKAKKRAARS